MERKNKSFNFNRAYKILLGGSLGVLTIAGCTVCFSPIAALSILLTLPIGALVGGGIIASKIVEQKKNNRKLKEIENKMVIDVMSPKTEDCKDFVVDVESIINNSPSYKKERRVENEIKMEM